MIRNEKLGNITRLIMSVLDYKTPCDLSLASEMKDYELTFSQLRENRPFIIGVVSGFTMNEIVERWFNSKVDTGTDESLSEPVLEVIHDEDETSPLPEGYRMLEVGETIPENAVYCDYETGDGEWLKLGEMNQHVGSDYTPGEEHLPMACPIMAEVLVEG